MSQEIIRRSLAPGGVAVMAACACGATTGTVKALSAAGIQTGNPVIHPIFVGLGAVLVLLGLRHLSASATRLAMAGFGLLAIGAVLAPPRIMTLGNIPHPVSHLAGFLLYIGAAVLLVLAFMRAYAPSNPRAAGTAMAGMALATGCNCCLVTGAVTGLVGSTGLGMPWIHSWTLFYVLGAGLILAGLHRMAGIRPAMLALAGAAIAYKGPALFRMILPDMILDGISLRFVPTYWLYLIGAAMIMGAFAMAFRRVEEGSGEPSLLRKPAMAEGN